MRRNVLGLATVLPFAIFGQLWAQQPAAAPAAESTAQTIDVGDMPDIVATINGTTITRDQLFSEAQGAYQQLRQIGRMPVVDRGFLERALDQIIAGLLIHEEAKSHGVGATVDEVNQRLLQVRASFPTEEAFQNNLTRGGTTEDRLRDELAREISRGKYLNSQIASAVSVTEDELRLFYDQNLERMRQPERVKVRHILIVPEGEATEEQTTLARQRAEALRARAAGGEDFAALAYENSADESRNQGGELPWLVRGQTVPGFEEAIFASEPGSISGVVRSRLGFHIIKGIDRQNSRIASFEEVQERVELLIRTQKAQDLLLSRIADLVAAADIERFLQ